MKTNNETDKLIKEVSKPVTLICFRFETVLSSFIVVAIIKIAVMGINSKSISNIVYRKILIYIINFLNMNFTFKLKNLNVKLLKSIHICKVSSHPRLELGLKYQEYLVLPLNQ